MTRIDRRSFIGGALAAGAFGGCRGLLASSNAYSVPLLGDMHYDAFPRERFHATALRLWKEKGSRHPARLKEFDRNAKMWQGVSRQILAASAAVRPDNAAFVLQTGDLVQGDCEDAALHAAMLGEATDLLGRTYPGLPVVSVCGNHDVREGDNDRGATKAYADFMLPYESRQLAAWLPDGVRHTTFGFRCGCDLWIAIDFTSYGRKLDIEIVKRLLADNPDVRYTFVVCHAPLLPMPVWKCRWFYLGEERCAAARRELRALLARRQAIVLAGHEHTLTLKDWCGDGGRITEMVVNTCAGTSMGTLHPAEPNVLMEGVEGLPAWVAEQKPDLRGLYEEYLPGIRRFYVARAVGHHVLHVADAGVTLDYYGHDAQTPTKVFAVRCSRDAIDTR